MKTIKMIASVLVAGLLTVGGASATEKNSSKKAATYKVDDSKIVVKSKDKKVTG